MLVQVRTNEIRLIRQADHALLSGAMASAWGRGSFETPRPHHLVTVAVALHDVAWQEVDETPLLNPATHIPHNVFDYPTPSKVGFFQRGVSHVEVVHPYVGLLGSLHYSSFGFLCNEIEYQQREAERQARLRRTVGDSRIFEEQGGTADEVTSLHLEFLRLMDRLSLFICNTPPGSKKLHLPPKIGTSLWDAWNGYLGPELFEQVPTRRLLGPMELQWDGEERLLFDPFPFCEEVRVTLPYRRLGAEQFADANALREAWMMMEAGEQVLTLAAR
jgi:hypothetical protein